MDKPFHAPDDAAQLTKIWDRLGRIVSLYPKLAKAVGIPEAIFLQQLRYWTGRSKRDGGWVYKSADEWEEETGLTYRQQGRVRKQLKKLGVIEERLARREHRLYFRLVPERLASLILGPDVPDETSGASTTKRQEAADEASGRIWNTRIHTKLQNHIKPAEQPGGPSSQMKEIEDRRKITAMDQRLAMEAKGVPQHMSIGSAKLITRESTASVKKRIESMIL